MNEPLRSDPRPGSLSHVAWMFQQSGSRFVLLAAVPYLVLFPPLFVFMLHLAHISFGDPSANPAEIWNSMTWIEKLSFFIGIAVSFWLPSLLAARGISRIASDLYLNRVTATGRILAEMAAYIPIAVVYALVIGVPAQMSMGCMGVASILITTVFALTVSAAVVEQAGIFGAVRRSFSLVRHVFGKVFLSISLYGIVLVVAYVAVALTVSLLLPSSGWLRFMGISLFFIPALLAFVLLNIRLTLLYFEAVARAAQVQIPLASSTTPQ